MNTTMSWMNQPSRLCLYGAILAVLVNLPASAERPPKPSVAAPNAASPAQVLHDTLRTRVLIDRPGDGAIWARGLHYKASFSAEGFTYIPQPSTGAQQASPVRMSVQSVSIAGVPVTFDPAVAPAADGSRIIFNRGPFKEIYELRPESIEQLFEITDEALRPERGDLAVQLRVQTSLPMRDSDAAIVLGDSPGLVRYGHAAVKDRN